MRLLLAFGLAFLSVGCYDDFNELYDESRDTWAAVQVVTDPPGANIVVEGGYVGKSPCTAKVRQTPSGKFRDFITIKALPVTDGQSVQVETFGCGDYVPKTVFLDMNLTRRIPDVMVEVEEW